jgi:hypothetical protein
MGPGHFGIAFAAKPVAPKAPLWLLLVASELLDLLTFLFAGIGMERIGTSQTDIEQGTRILTPASVPWSHGLVMSLVWSILVAGLAILFIRDRRTAGMLGLVIFSHWILDFLVHPADLPLFFAGSPTLGLGLWSTGPGLILSGILEFGLLAGGIAIYMIWRKKK